MVVYSDELRHGIRGWIKSGHKYIKREWHNGRWRYWYRQKPTTPKLSDPNGKVITENIIQEKIIPEETISENKIHENVITENKKVENTKPERKRLTRELKNGHWTYQYSTKPDSSLKETIRRVSGLNARDYANEKIRDYNRSKANSEGYSKIKTDPTREKWYNESKEKALRDDTTVKGILANRAIQNYYKTPLGQVQKAKDVIEDGRNIVADILSSASKKIRASKSQYF